MKAELAVLRGDGVGPEIIDQAIKVLEATAERFGHQFHLRDGLVGNHAFRETGHGLPEETIELCQASDAVLLGATGGFPEDPRPPKERDGKNLRQHLELSCNLRAVKVARSLLHLGPVKPEAKVDGVDFVIARDVAARGAYGPGGLEVREGIRLAEATFTFTKAEVERTVRPAFEVARQRRGRIHLVGYWNIIGCSDIWREVYDEIAEDYPDVEHLYMLPDHCNMLVVRDPSVFDVILFDDLFRAGMVADLGALLLGSLGMGPPSAMLRPRMSGAGGDEGTLRQVFGMYEPSHGCVPGRAGQDQVNPTATILAAAELLRYSLDLPQEAHAVEDAIMKVVGDGYRTYDIMEQGTKLVGCSELGERIAAAVAEPAES